MEFADWLLYQFVALESALNTSAFTSHGLACLAITS